MKLLRKYRLRKKIVKSVFMEMRSRNQLFGILFALPAIIGFIIFILVPMLISFIISFSNYSIFTDMKFIGFQNYIELFSGHDPFFYKSLLVTVYYVALNVPVSIIFSYFLAILLTKETRLKALFRTVFYLPSIVPVVASSFIWLWLLNPDLGLINSLLSSLGLPTSMWLYSENTVIPSIVLTGLWGVGNTMIIFMAALESIPEQYYEAANIDGGTLYNKLVYITIPMTTPTIFFNTVMGIIGSFQIFTQAYILTQGGPNNASLFYVFFLWREAFRNTRMGFASAIAWILFIIIMIFTYIIFKSQKSWVYYEGEGKG